MINSKWTKLGKVPWISTASSISMALMGQGHFVIFGSNQEQDGAIIIAYNYVLGVASCRYPMKMYKENSKVFCYNGRIILEASNHIGMLPYVIEANRNLSSLLESHEIIQDEVLSIADWGTPIQPLFKSIPELEESIQLGITERSACAQVIPTLIEKNNAEAIINILRESKDVPESALAMLVGYAVKSHIPDNDDVECELLNEIFNVLFCDALLIPHLRNNLSVTDSLHLMKYILYLLFQSDLPLNADYESRLYDWCALILDSFYQQYVISKDPEVETTLIHLSMYLKSLVKNILKMSHMIMRLHKLVSSKGKDDDEEYLPYAIEIMQI